MLGKSHILATGSLTTGALLGSYHIEKFRLSAFTDGPLVDPSLFEKIQHGFLTGVVTLNNYFMSFLHLDWSDLLVESVEPAVFFGLALPSSFFVLLSLLTILVCAMFGALIPDIDEPNSMLGRYVAFIGRLLEHRGGTHTLWAVLILMAITIYGLKYMWFAAIVFGYFLHLVEDSFSRQGIAWLYPITKYRKYPNGAAIKKGRNPKFLYYRTGEPSEFVFLTVLMVCWIYFIYQWYVVLF